MPFSDTPVLPILWPTVQIDDCNSCIISTVGEVKEISCTINSLEIPSYVTVQAKGVNYTMPGHFDRHYTAFLKIERTDHRKKVKCSVQNSAIGKPLATEADIFIRCKLNEISLT